MKAVQHLREAGKIEDSPKDIGKLIIEVQKDLGQEEKEEIKTLLWKWAWPHISRMATRGVAEWYKEQLLAKQFENEGDPTTGAPATLYDAMAADIFKDELKQATEFEEPSSADR